MAAYSYSKRNWTPVAVADTTAFTDEGYMAVQGGGSTQRVEFAEVYMGGLAAASAPAQMILARDSTVGATALSGVMSAALDGAATAPGTLPSAFSTSTTKPQRSATLQLLQLGFNAFGGIVRWVAAPGEEFSIVGNTASLGEISLSHGAAGTPGLMMAHIVGHVK